MRSQRALYVGTIALNGGLVAVPQILALVTLPLKTYGAFSVVYLIYAWALSISMSVTMESWSRAGKPNEPLYIKGYSGSLAVIACVFAVACGFAGWFLGLSFASATACVIAPLGLVLWAGSRFRLLQSGSVLRVVAIEAAALFSLVGAVIIWGLVGNRSGNDEIFFAVWAAPASVLCVGALASMREGVGAVKFWFQNLGRDIRILLSDSVLMDIGAIGTPLGLAPLLGSQGIAVYRSIANAGFPVRILVSSARPLMHRIAPSRWRTVRFHGLIVVASAALGSFIALLLAIADRYLESEVVAELVSRLLLVGVFCFANFYSSIVYIACRSISSGRALLTGRFIHTSAVISLPLVGYALGGLDGAISGFVFSTCFICVLWGVISVLSSSDK